MRTRRMSYATVLGLWALPSLVLLSCALGPCVSQSSDVDLKSLCANKAVDLTRISQIKSLVEELDSSVASAECPERLRLALKDLDQMIGEINGNVCSLEAVEKIRKFYDTYISKTFESGNRNQQPLPKPLENLVLAFGLRVSKLCKKNMINSLTVDSQTLLKDSDHQMIGPWTDEQSLITRLMSEPEDYDDLLLPRDFIRINEDANEEDDNDDAATAAQREDDDDMSRKLFIQTATGPLIKTMQAACERRFRPIYEQLILPLIYLSNMGFNYQGEELERELREMSSNKEIHQWYRTVYFCESLLDVEIVEDPEDAERTQDTDFRVVRILTKEEAAKIKAEFEASPRGHDEELKIKGIERVVYKQEYSTQIEDEVLDFSDNSLVKLVKKFATHKSELHRIRLKLIRKLAKFMMNQLKLGHLNIIGSLMSSMTSNNGGQEVHSANNEIVKALDEFIKRATISDGPVSGSGGLKGLAKRYYYKAATDGVGALGGRALRRGLHKGNLRWYLWYCVAVSLFVLGASMLFFG